MLGTRQLKTGPYDREDLSRGSCLEGLLGVLSRVQSANTDPLIVDAEEGRHGTKGRLHHATNGG